ncbi:Ribosome production factor 1 [Ceratobasidium theobromae]|uniref:Ribosome production factor 1 n=1 Tax=Ceratobasidium theobromae TaxID=1582974 RepID=A0A5N5QS72_9AGAM|nr:Ribosome production factor 1 [Ceratobasidium theobromae]
MPPTRFEPSRIKNRIKRQDVHREAKRSKGQAKLKQRLALKEAERKDPSLKQKRIKENVPRTLDNTREFNASIIPVGGSSIQSVESAEGAHEESDKPTHPGPGQMDPENANDIANDDFAEHFNATTSANFDPAKAPKVLITTSQKATKASFQFCEELVSVFPGAEFIRRKRGHGFELGRIAGWAANRGYGAMVVVNEDVKKPNAMTIIHLPEGPTAYFRLTSVQTTVQISGHARPSPHYPELVLNGFVTRLGLTVGRLFQTLFPVMPEFEGRQVVTLHNQRDFLFFRRHRYAFRSAEKAALQEIGPRFTLKLRSLKKGLPVIEGLSKPPPPLEFANEDKQPSEATEGDDLSNEKEICVVKATERVPNAGGDFEQPIISLIIFGVALITSVNALHFYLDSNERRCFIEELPTDTIVEGHYRALEWDEKQNKYLAHDSLGIQVDIEEVHSGHRVTRTRGPSEGRFTFTSHESGDHSICLSTNYTAGWFSNSHIRMYLDINVGAAKPNVEHDRDHVTEMADKVRELNHKLAEIRREQQYQREREASFRDLNHGVVVNLCMATSPSQGMF